ncbi:MAG: hypothetical protein D6723_08300 [Acidobacteria bacterium]|nr:MAG: hypothetical protein D6723_08300 [Acidobacteriota bacterium]
MLRAEGHADTDLMRSPADRIRSPWSCLVRGEVIVVRFSFAVSHYLYDALVKGEVVISQASTLPALI